MNFIFQGDLKELNSLLIQLKEIGEKIKKLKKEISLSMYNEISLFTDSNCEIQNFEKDLRKTPQIQAINTTDVIQFKNNLLNDLNLALNNSINFNNYENYIEELYIQIAELNKKRTLMLKTCIKIVSRN